MTTPAELSLTEFARLRGIKGSYVTQLKKEGRLVLTDDGKRVRVPESIARIEATRDPAMAGVAERHAANRLAKAGGSDAPAAAPPEAHTAVSGAEKIGNTYQAARAVKERYLAMSAKRDYEVSVGKLLPADEVRGALANAVATMRIALEALPDSLAPVMAGETDEARIRILLSDEIEHALGELARQFADIAKEELPA